MYMVLNPQPSILTLNVVESECVCDLWKSSGDFRKHWPFGDSNHSRLRGRVNLCERGRENQCKSNHAQRNPLRASQAKKEKEIDSMTKLPNVMMKERVCLLWGFMRFLVDNTKLWALTKLQLYIQCSQWAAGVTHFQLVSVLPLCFVVLLLHFS